MPNFLISPLAFWTPGPGEMLLIGVIALLLYGGKLPEVAREWGKTFNELRRNLTVVRDDLNDAIHSEPGADRRLEYHPAFQDDRALDEVAGATSDADYEVDAAAASDAINGEETNDEATNDEATNDEADGSLEPRREDAAG